MYDTFVGAVVVVVSIDSGYQKTGWREKDEMMQSSDESKPFFLMNSRVHQAWTNFYFGGKS